MYVVSHHCSDYEAVEISKFIKLCKKNNIPTIIDAASEEYMELFSNLEQMLQFLVHINSYISDSRHSCW